MVNHFRMLSEPVSCAPGMAKEVVGLIEHARF